MLDIATIQAALDSKVKPVGALGRLEPLAAQIAAACGTLRPELKNCALILFAADHGVACEGVSAYPQSVTREMCRTFLTGGAASMVLARQLGVAVRVVDCGISGEPLEHPCLVRARIAPGTANFVDRPAMSPGHCEKALRIGADQINAIDADVYALGEMGIANTSASSMIAHKVMCASLEVLTGNGAGLDDAGVLRKRAVLERAAQRTSAKLAPMDALIEYGGFEIAAMTGAMLAAADARRLVLVDGFIATAAALCAETMQPSAAAYFIYAHQSAERGHRTMLAHLNRQPLLDLEMRLGEGVGALLAWPLVRAAAAVLREMASFEEAGVSGAT